jgi:hypothetical protein
MSLRYTERLVRSLKLGLERDQECQDDPQVDCDRSAMRCYFNWLQYG